MELRDKFTVSDICFSLGISRSVYYYKPKHKDESIIFDKVIKVFENNSKRYGSRRIQFKLRQEGLYLSRRKISNIMAIKGLESVYGKPKFKKHPTTEGPKSDMINLVARQFSDRKLNEVIVSDTTYFRLFNKWSYLCPILDLSDRYVVGCSVSNKRDSRLAEKAFHSIKGDLRKMGIFHSDRGSEFNNELINDLLSGFSIKRSFSNKGNPYDNAVIESFNNTIKKEFINCNKFDDMEVFVDKLREYINWYNNERIHSSLGYKTPSEWRKDGCKE